MSQGPRFYCPAPLRVGAQFDLPASAVRHAQVLRLQPGSAITLFGGDDKAPGVGEFEATITAMGRQSVQVLVGTHHAVERELSRRLVLAIGMPANERMDWLVEKATELGVSAIQPLMTERSVVRLDEQRARKRCVHWQSIAIAACEQCGRNRVPQILMPSSLPGWCQQFVLDPPDASAPAARLLLSLRQDAASLRDWTRHRCGDAATVTLLCGPEGGLSAAEETLAGGHGFAPLSLGQRVLRSETAAMVAITLLA